MAQAKVSIVTSATQSERFMTVLCGSFNWRTFFHAATLSVDIPSGMRVNFVLNGSVHQHSLMLDPLMTYLRDAGHTITIIDHLYDVQFHPRASFEIRGNVHTSTLDRVFDSIEHSGIMTDAILDLGRPEMAVLSDSEVHAAIRTLRNIEGP